VTGSVQRGAIHNRRWHILAVLVVCALLIMLDNTILNVALTTIQLELDASTGDLQWAIDAYVLVFAGLLLTWGMLGDRFGRRRILMTGLLIYGAASAQCAFSDSAGQLIAARALMGVGAGAIMPQTLSIISNVFEPAERGRAIGIWAGFGGQALAIGPLTSGLLLEHFWWGSVFLINVPLAALGLVATMLLVPESCDPEPGRIDPAGVLLSTAGLALLVYGIITGGHTNEWASLPAAGAMLAGAALLAAFVLHQRRSPRPMLDVTLFGNPQFSAAAAAIGLAFFGLMGVLFYLSFYFQAVRDYGPLQAGLCLVAIAAALVIAAPRSPALAQRYGPKLVCGVGLAVAATCFGLYFFVQRDTPPWVVEVLLFVHGLGMGSVAPTATNAIMCTVPREKAGAGAAVNTTIRQVGGALGVAVLGSLLSGVYRGQVGPSTEELPAQVRGDAAAAAAFVHAMHVTSLAAATVAFTGAVIALLFLPGRSALRAPAEQHAHEPRRRQVGARGVGVKPTVAESGGNAQ
jgi:EmrB/QacA subfamily drug resistance transporter